MAAQPASALRAVKSSPVQMADYAKLYRSSAIGRIALIREGVRASDIRNLVGSLGIQQKDFLNALNISQATLSRKAASDIALSSSDSERVLGVAKLIGKVEAMVAESGDVRDFDAPAWVGRWLVRPNRALGNARPITYLDTMEGQSLLSDLLGRQQSGAYA